MKKLISLFASIIILSTSIFALDKPIVQDIKAQVANASFISISWTLPDTASINKLWLYRSLQPLKKTSDLNKAERIVELDYRMSGWTDILPDFNDYYYAVITVAKGTPYNVIVPSLNATTTPVHMDPPPEKPAEKIEKPEKLYESGTLRETPLPYLGTDATQNSNYLKEELSKAAVESVKELTYYQEEEIDILKPYYFEEDLISPDGGDDFLLFTILKDYFIKRDYKGTIRQLNKLIGTNITDSVQNRAYFYLGESQYYSGDYEECVRTFVKVSQIYPQQTKRWINSALDKF